MCLEFQCSRPSCRARPRCPSACPQACPGLAGHQFQQHSRQKSTTSIRKCARWTNTFCFSSPLTSVHIGEPAYYTPSCRSPTFVPPLGWLDSPGWGPTASTEHRTAKSGGGNPELSLVDFRRSRLHLDGGKNTSDGVDGLPLVLDYVETQNTICVYCTRWRKGQQRMR